MPLCFLPSPLTPPLHKCKAYHSNFNKFSCKSVAKIAILPFEARFSKGSAPFWNPNDPYLKDNKCDGDIINEGLKVGLWPSFAQLASIFSTIFLFLVFQGKRLFQEL